MEQNEAVRAYVAQYPQPIIALFERLRGLIYRASPQTPRETLWARMPGYYVGDTFVRLIPFKDHINVEASALRAHADALSAYTLTPKGMLRLSPDDPLPEETLLCAFTQTLAGI